MKAVVWHGQRDVRVETMPDPTIEEPTDAIVEITSSGLCGSDLHLYEVMGPFMTPGDILGHEPMGIVRAVGASVDNLAEGDRVVVPFNISCGHCFMCDHGLQSQCETTQNRDSGTGASLFGYTKLYGQVPGGAGRTAAGATRRLRADQGAGGTTGRSLRVPVRRHADGMAGRRVGGCGARREPRRARSRPDRRHGLPHRAAPRDRDGDRGRPRPRTPRSARERGVDVLDLDELDRKGIAEAVDDRTAGRGADGVIDAVGMEAHGSPVAKLGHKVVGMMPDRVAEKLMTRAGTDRLAALQTAIEVVRRGGTISVIGVYGGMTDPLPLLTLFDKQVHLRMGQANVRHWVDDLMPLVGDDDPLGLDTFATHRLPLEEAPAAYAMFQAKRDGAVKVLFQP